MTARMTSGFRRGALAALLGAALLGGCTSAREAPPVAGAPSSDGLIRMGDKARDRGELPVAASLYRRAHDVDREQVRPLVSLGQVLTQMQRPDQAAEAFSAALVLEPSNLEALRGLGNARLALHQPAEAIPPLKQALAISSTDFRILNALGVAHDLTGDRPAAHQYYRTGLKLAPDNAPIRSNYALSLALSGDTEEALETMAPIAKAPHPTAQQRQTMALVYGLAGQQTEAERLARMDLDEEAVTANMVRIAALRDESAPVAQAPQPDAPKAVPVAAVVTEPLPGNNRKVAPVALQAVAKVQPSAAPEKAAAQGAPAAPKPTAAPAAAQQQAALAPAAAPSPSPAPGAQTKAAAAPAKQTGDAWLVQLASYAKPELAEKGWREISASAPDLLASRKPVVQESRLADQSTVWRLRTGPFPAYSEAAGLCERLKSKGVDCFVAQPGS
jgi:Flp pilus assembly protein TadD